MIERKDIEPRRCAIYTRKSTDERLERDFNSLQSQREICSAYIMSQRHKGWLELPNPYDDPAQSGATLVRPALQELMADIERGRIDVVVIYKIDRLTRSLGDFIRLMDVFDRYSVSFVSITQSFDTSDSMGRLVLNVLLTFAQFEREMAADRVRDKVAAMKRRGKWTGGKPPLGYNLVDGKLVVNPDEAETVRHIFKRFVELGSYAALRKQMQSEGLLSKRHITRKGIAIGGGNASNGMIYGLLGCRYYIGEVPHFDENFPGEHEPIIPRDLWDEAQALRAQRSMYKLELGPSPNVLLGMIHDGHGVPMTIADDSTKGRRYRYYISTQSRWAIRHGVKRLRAEACALEQLVVAGLSAFFNNREQLRAAVTAMGRYESSIEKSITEGPAAARRLTRAPVERLRLMLQALLVRLEVSREHVKLFTRCRDVERFLHWDGRGIFRPDPTRRGDDPYVHLIHLPATAVRSERVLTLPSPPPPRPDAKPSRGLVSLLHEARRVQQVIDTERSTGFAAIARRFRRHPSFMARIVRLNYLAPDIAGSIFDGTQPSSMTRKTLVYANLPMDWALQRQLLGFPERGPMDSSGQRY